MIEICHAENFVMVKQFEQVLFELLQVHASMTWKFRKSNQIALFVKIVFRF